MKSEEVIAAAVVALALSASATAGSAIADKVVEVIRNDSTQTQSK